MNRKEAKEELWNTRKDIVNFTFHKVDEHTEIGLVTRSDEGKLYNSSRTIIDKIYDDFEARTCDSCKHKYIFDSMRTDCRHNDSPIDFLDLDCFPDFGCNKWEQK